MSQLASELFVPVGNQNDQELVLEILPAQRTIPLSLSFFILLPVVLKFAVKFKLIIVDVDKALADTSDSAHEELPVLIVHGDTNGELDALGAIAVF